MLRDTLLFFSCGSCLSRWQIFHAPHSFVFFGVVRVFRVGEFLMPPFFCFLWYGSCLSCWRILDAPHSFVFFGMVRVFRVGEFLMPPILLFFFVCSVSFVVAEYSSCFVRLSWWETIPLRLFSPDGMRWRVPRSKKKTVHGRLAHARRHRCPCPVYRPNSRMGISSRTSSSTSRTYTENRAVAGVVSMNCPLLITVWAVST